MDGGMEGERSKHSAFPPIVSISDYIPHYKAKLHNHLLVAANSTRRGSVVHRLSHHLFPLKLKWQLVLANRRKLARTLALAPCQ